MSVFDAVEVLAEFSKSIRLGLDRFGKFTHPRWRGPGQSERSR